MPDSSTVTGVLLAAGPSRRFMAAVPKQLWPVDGEPLVARVAKAALESRVGELIVVVGHEADRVSDVLAGLRVRIVANPAFMEGQASSVKSGLSAIGPEASGALFIPADQPLLGCDLIDRLILSFEVTGGPIVVPTFEGERGAPVLFARNLFHELAGLVGDAGGRQLFSRHADNVVELPLTDPAPLVDVDTPEDLEKLGL